MESDEDLTGWISPRSRCANLSTSSGWVDSKNPVKAPHLFFLMRSMHWWWSHTTIVPAAEGSAHTQSERMAHTRSNNNNCSSSRGSSSCNNKPLRQGQSSGRNKELATLLFEYYSIEKDTQEEEEEEEEQKQQEAELAISTTSQDSGFVQQSSRQHDHHHHHPPPPIQQQKHSLSGSDWSDLQWFDFQAPSFGYSNEEAEGPISSSSLPLFSFSTLLGDDAANTDKGHVDDNERKNVVGCKEKEEKDNGLASLSSLSLNNAPIGSGLHFARSKKLERRTTHPEVNRVEEQREAEYQRLERQFEMEMEMMEVDLGFIAPYHTDQQDHQQQNQQHHHQQEMDNSPRYLHQRRGNHILQSLSHTHTYTHTYTHTLAKRNISANIFRWICVVPTQAAWWKAACGQIHGGTRALWRKTKTSATNIWKYIFCYVY